MINTQSGKKLELFADDTNLFLTGMKDSTLNDRCNSCINDLNRWLIANDLHVKIDKTNVMILPCCQTSNICVTLNQMTIEIVHVCRYWEY